MGGGGGMSDDMRWGVGRGVRLLVFWVVAYLGYWGVGVLSAFGVYWGQFTSMGEALVGTKAPSPGCQFF